MITYKLKNTLIVTYETEFIDSEEYYRKFSCVRDGFIEGPWMLIHPDDIYDYDNDYNLDKVRLGVALNDCLNGIPYGAIFPYELREGERPVCNMNYLVDLTAPPQIVLNWDSPSEGNQ